MAAKIDCRSDTVTKPSTAMREAMANAEVGDDVMGEDPTINKLQKLAAEMFGKEAALFVPSGTMGNLIAVLTWCSERDSEMILGDHSHIHFYEAGGSAVLGGVHSRTARNLPDGTLDLAEVASLVRSVDDHFPTTRLLCLENTHNRMGGKVLSVEYTDAAGALCKSKNLKLHIDGARIMNAAVKLQVSPARLVQAADSVSVCLSKGLGAPVGSVLVGPADFIQRARRLRKMLGGGMRQAGVLAACGLVSLSDASTQRLAEDHANAKEFVRGVVALGRNGITADEAVETNIAFILVDSVKLGIDASEVASRLKANGLLCNAASPTRVRIVTHLHITAEDIRRAVEIVSQTFQ